MRGTSLCVTGSTAGETIRPAWVGANNGSPAGNLEKDEMGGKWSAGIRAGAPEDQVDTSEEMAEVEGAVIALSGTEHNAVDDGRLPRPW